MTTAREWYEGARPRTLGAAVAPVLVGTAAASLDGPIVWWRAAAALAVALALQVGVNYANDYSDGIRGTDTERRGPLRLTATGTATPTAVRRAAIISFGTAAVVGGVLSLVVNPWLLLVGAASIAAAALYTGGPKPYGYHGFGEVAVLVFFGLVATVGSAYVQHETIPAEAWLGAFAVGLLACALLVVNNLRDIETDLVAGKKTLAVRIGRAATQDLYTLSIAGAFVAVVVIGILRPPALLALAALPLSITPVRIVRARHADAKSLVAALIATSRLELVVAVLLAIGLVVA
ncbi:MAG: 1,4-dihydroxy-2-naphthoate polyprenyltransferase [Actinomycetota bacterium]|jgi:1,4-dihydroxy-2-naphthoate octaprenyltransferase|nr:1,4-dihydroxy-2-naphthoate polyprenyltransferase [Actinomycetota bacterium]